MSSFDKKDFMRTYHVFVSHSWSYGDVYDKLISFFKDEPYFDFKDYSVPKDDPIHNAANDSALRTAIKNQMVRASAILVLAGVYSTYSKWISKEIELAKEMGKPIIAIEPWASEKTSTLVKNNADVIVKWQASSIVQAIKNNCL